MMEVRRPTLHDRAGDAAQTDGVDGLITDPASKVSNLSVAFDHTRIRVRSV